MWEKRTITDACCDRLYFLDKGGHELVVDQLAEYEASTGNASLP